jgi:hypothetical protein
VGFICVNVALAKERLGHYAALDVTSQLYLTRVPRRCGLIRQKGTRGRAKKGETSWVWRLTLALILR